MAEEGALTLTVAYPTGGESHVSCDSVRFQVPDSKDGKQRGGSVGIRRGHIDALMAVDEGDVLGFTGGREVFRRRVRGGLAIVSRNKVMILAESGSAEDAEEAE